MTSASNLNRFNRLRLRALALAMSLSLVATLAMAGGPVPPAFSKIFEPETIGPGSVSMLIFTIDNSESSGPVGMMAFDDELPFGLELAAPAFVSNTCGGIVEIDDDDADSAFDVRLTDGAVGVTSTCTIVVNVTGPSPGEGPFTNITGDLTSDAGNSGTAEADLMVSDSLPGFTKSFDPSTVPFGGRSTLTFTIDNSANEGDVEELSFTDTLPTGMAVADPALASTDCGDPLIPAVLTAVPGTSFISLVSDGIISFPALEGGETCTVVVDVIGGAVGSLGNVTGDLFLELGGLESVGKAAAVLEVTGVEDLLELAKEFIDDPAAPGGTTTLEFTVTNKSRDDSATAITFDDDLEATLADLTPTLPGTPDPPCGAGSSLAFSLGVLTLTGGTLPPEGSCTFSVELTVDPASAPGSYPNTTGPVSGDVGGSPETGNVAGDLLFVVPFPVLTKEFTDDPVAAGGSVTLEFTITNPGSSAMTDITFLDELTDNSGGLGGGSVGNGFLPFPVSVTLPPVPDPPCGAGSSLSLIFIPGGTDRQGLELTGGSLAAAGMAGDSCTFSVTLDIPVGLAGGIYHNTTEEITATVDAATVTGPQASDTVVIASAPDLSKEFTDDPVLPAGGPVTLEFTLTYDVEEGTPDATAIAFTDDLTALAPPVPGLVAASVDTNTCAGATVDISTPTTIDFSGGTLSAGESCTVILTLTVPAASPLGFHTNTTSDVTATVDGVMAANVPAQDDLLITPLVFTKEFLDGDEPVIPGDTVTLRFTITNNGTSSTDDATAMAFSDTLSAILPGTPDVTNPGAGPPSVNTCGGTEAGALDTFLFYSGGSLTFGSTCTVEYDLVVPAAAADGDYLNVSSSLSAVIDGSGVTVAPATDVLSVGSTLLELTKEFTDDPVFPGDPVTLEFTLTNLSAVETVTDIAFDDDLGGVLAGLEATAALLNDCGGMAAGFPAAVFEYSGGSLPPSSSCTIQVAVDVPAAPLTGSVYANTTTEVTGKVDGTLDVRGEPASDDLTVQLLTFEKSFDGPNVAGGPATLTFTITNLDSSEGKADLSFSDDLDSVISGLTATLPPTPDPPCGAGSALAGTSFLALTGGNLAAAGSPGDSCTFEVTVTVPAAATGGDFLNTTSSLSRSGLPVADPATAFLVVEPPPTFGKVFAPDAIFAGAVSTLTFTIDNTASGVAATALDFTDTFPVPVVVATPPGASTDCTGGTLTATAGAGVVSYSGGEVAAGASCTVVVDVTTNAPGVFDNETGDLTSSSGNSGTAMDSLTATGGDADLELVKTDVFEPVMSGRYQIYELTATNLGPALAESVVIVDPLPAGTTLIVAEPADACSEALGIVTCTLGDLSVSGSTTVTITSYVDLVEVPVPLENMASVSSDTTDPVPGNNDFMEMTEVIPLAGVAALDNVDADGGGFPEVAVTLAGSVGVLVKDVDSNTVLHQTEVFPAGWALAGFRKAPGVDGGKDGVAVLAVETATEVAQVRVIAGDDGALISTGIVPAGFLPVTMTVIPDDGTARTLAAVGAVSRTGRRAKIFFFDCSSGYLAKEHFLSPGAWPIGLAGLSNFSGGVRVEVGILWINHTNGRRRIQVNEFPGTVVNVQNQPFDFFPLALERIAHFFGTPADELVALGWDQPTGKARVRTVQADGSGVVQDGEFANMAQPMALRAMPDITFNPADEFVALFRNRIPRAAVRVRDADTGQDILFAGLIDDSVALGLAVTPNPSDYDGMADEVVIYWSKPNGDLRVSLVDAGSNTVVKTVLIP